ncbi:uncharacterized protein CLUP02_02543 [Colletotrichum lupini]|uniref:Uncharacterized protein n=1 Tax=Colletotrichum lupini TaxID=145971 RepID=A0A9Q8WBW1_9PEZI|nr:uncharacterized protein CLUP02_02543 [Colletotrichum lupini]UQC77077.1 hypothetical protein CLUP02_02543 [Colletotrichum lupini]
MTAAASHCGELSAESNAAGVTDAEVAQIAKVPCFTEGPRTAVRLKVAVTMRKCVAVLLTCFAKIGTAVLLLLSCCNLKLWLIASCLFLDEINCGWPALSRGRSKMPCNLHYNCLHLHGTLLQAHRYPRTFLKVASILDLAFVALAAASWTMDADFPTPSQSSFPIPMCFFPFSLMIPRSSVIIPKGICQLTFFFCSFTGFGRRPTGNVDLPALPSPLKSVLEETRDMDRLYLPTTSLNSKKPRSDPRLDSASVHSRTLRPLARTLLSILRECSDALCVGLSLISSPACTARRHGVDVAQPSST